MVILSTFASGLASALTTSGMPVNSLSMTAAWLYSWKASAFTFIAFASASPFLKMISASASPCCADRRSVTFGFRHQALLLGLRQSLDALTLDLGLLQHGRDQFFLAAIDFGLLHLDLPFFLDLPHAHALGDDLLLHDVGLNVVRLVGLRLLLLGDFEILRFLDLEVALRFGLLGLRQRFRQHSLLVGLRLRDRGFARAPAHA